jgi:pantoate--beta-alanine ligase
MQALAESFRKGGKVIGLVPTMGALHDGHLTLVKMAARKADIVIVSIFVNPTQFGPREDFSRYPRAFKSDCEKVKSAGGNVIFHPSVSDIYPTDFSTFIETGPISEILEGARRPGHFRGVSTICAKLFNISKPHFAVFGQKDGQQLAIIRKMVRELNFDLEIIRGPIVRTKTGIAMSSRHAYLSNEDLEKATVIRESLTLAESLIKAGNRSVKVIESRMRKLVGRVSGAEIDYVAFNRWDDLMTLKTLSGRVIISMVVRINGIRLLDNMIMSVNRKSR